MNRREVERLRRVRRELDEAAEHIERLARDLERAPVKVARNSQLVGAAEIAELTGLSKVNVRVMTSRGQLPEPVAELSCGRIWLRADIVQWNKRRAAA